MNHLEKLLGELVSINSVYPNERSIAQFLYGYLTNLGFKVERQFISKNRFNIFASRGFGEKATCFYGHLDTVPIEEQNWKTTPFELTKKGDKWFGSGAYDMKGGIAAFLEAVEAVKDSKRYIKILLAVDEENISEGAWTAVQKKKSFFEDVELIISAEPNFGLGLNSITRGRTGRVEFKVQFEGKPVHIVKYQDGIDAIELMGNFISQFYAKRETLFHCPKTVALIKKVEASSNGMSVCGNANLEVEVFPDSKDTVEEVQNKIQSLTNAKVALKSRKTPYLQGYFFEDFPYRLQMALIIKKVTGLEIELKERSSVGDDNVLAGLGIPVITWGPNGGNAHTANEWVSSNSLRCLQKMYTLFLQN